jgi:glutamyl-tRNA synthetase
MDPPQRLARRLIEHWAYRRARGTALEEVSEVPLHAWVDAQGGFESPAVGDFVLATIPLVQERIKRLDEYPALARCFFAKDVGGYPTEDLVPKKHAPGQAKEMIEAVAQALGDLAGFAPPDIEEALRALGEVRGWKPRDLFQPVRVAVTGAKVSPPLFESMALIGRTRCLGRLAAAAAALA